MSIVSIVSKGIAHELHTKRGKAPHREDFILLVDC